MQIMITNGGPHPSDKWAEATADAILALVQIAEDSVSPEAAYARQAKRDLRPVLFEIFNDHHDRLQKHEQGELAKNARKRIAEAPSTAPHTPTTCQRVLQAMEVTPFSAHFEHPDVRDVVHVIICQHSADVMHIERCWHADRANVAKGA